jgi:uncharacterized repeat protein (TIGR02543 family)
MESPDSVYGWRTLGLTINSPGSSENCNFLFYNQRTAELGTFSVIFIIDGESSSVQVSEGEKVQRPDQPYKEGYTFVGWRVGSASGPYFDFETPVTAELTLYATFNPIVTQDYYNVSFRVFDESYSIAYTQQVFEGGVIDWDDVFANYPDSIANLALWCDESTGSIMWETGSIISKNLVLFPIYVDTPATARTIGATISSYTGNLFPSYTIRFVVEMSMSDGSVRYSTHTEKVSAFARGARTFVYSDYIVSMAWEDNTVTKCEARL